MEKIRVKFFLGVNKTTYSVRGFSYRIGISKTLQLDDEKSNYQSQMNDIDEFQGEFRWLSNFAAVEVVLNGITFKSVEHAYMSAKSEDPDWKLFCQNGASAGKVKKSQ